MNQIAHIYGRLPLLSDYDDGIIYKFLFFVILGVVAHFVIKRIKLNGSVTELLSKDNSYGLQNYTFNFSNLGASRYESTGFRKASFFVRAVAIILVILIISMPLYEMIPGLEPTHYSVFFGCMLP